MSLLFVDGFDHYATADVLKKWTSANGASSIQASSGRRGTGCLRLSIGGVNNLTKTIAQSATLIVGLAIYPTGGYGSGNTANSRIIQFLDAGSFQCGVLLNADGTLSVLGAAGTILGTSTFVLPIGAWTYLEFKATIADSIGAGTCKLRANGADIITLSAGLDLKATANASANQVKIGPNGNMSISVNYDWDDLYICNGSGGLNNDFLGDCRVDAVLPTGDGTYSEWTPSTGTAHAALVDEATPNTTDYVSSSTVGQRDTYAMGDLAAVTGTIYGVQVCAAALKDDAGSRTMAPMLRSNGNDSVGPDLGLSTSQLYAIGLWETNPDGGVTWTESAVNAVEAGVKVTG